jgi:hypothetical protein
MGAGGQPRPVEAAMPAFQGPIHADPEAAARAAARMADQVRCTCARFPCDGALSIDWLSCDRACRACQPQPFTPPTRTAALAAHEGTPGSANDA